MLLVALHFPVWMKIENFRSSSPDGKTFKKPRRPYEKERLDQELKLVGEYGLRCKRELWRVQYALSRIRNAAKELLKLDEKDEKRIFEGEALLRRMNRYGLLDESQNKLDYVLALTPEHFLERRLQTLVFKSGMAKSIHHARVLIRQRHIRLDARARLQRAPLHVTRSIEFFSCLFSHFSQPPSHTLTAFSLSFLALFFLFRIRSANLILDR